MHRCSSLCRTRPTRLVVSLERTNPPREVVSLETNNLPRVVSVQRAVVSLQRTELFHWSGTHQILYQILKDQILYAVVQTAHQIRERFGIHRTIGIPPKSGQTSVDRLERI
jgi:hypothetical protein